MPTLFNKHEWFSLDLQLSLFDTAQSEGNSPTVTHPSPMMDASLRRLKSSTTNSFKPESSLPSFKLSLVTTVSFLLPFLSL